MKKRSFPGLMALALGAAVTVAACSSPQNTAPAPTQPSAGAPSAASSQPSTPAPARQTNVTGGRVSLAYPTGDKATSAILIEKVAPAEVNAGRDFDYQIVVTNLTSLTLQDVVVQDELPANYRFSGANPSPQSGSGGRLVWPLGQIEPRGVRSIVVTGSAAGPGMITSCAEVSYNSTLCATTNVVEPQLELVKSSPAQVLACEPIPVRFVVTNRGSGAARNVRIEDTLPQGLTTADGLQAFAVDVGTLPAGEAREVTIDVRASQPGNYVNRATATADGGLRSDAQSQTRVVKPRLSITKTGPERQFIGRLARYSITVRNDGDGVARDARLQDAIPANLAFREASDGGRVSGSNVVWSLGEMAPGASRTVEVVFATQSRGMVRNTATASAYCADTVSASVETDIQGIPAILLEVIDVEDPVEVGTETNYVITVTNQGSATARNIRVVGTLDRGMEYVTSSGPTTGTSSGASIGFEPLATLAPGARAEWRVRVRATSAGDKRFRLEMTSAMLTRPVEETESTNFYE